MLKPRGAGKATKFIPLKSGRKSDQVFEQVTELIRSGRFLPGRRLPAERELSTMLNTSRQTVREALYRAELVGLIEVRHGAGSFVAADKAVAHIDKPITDLIKIESSRVGQFIDIRRALEGWCAAQAARTATKQQLAALKTQLEAMRKLDVADPAWEENDIAFHATLAAATGNPLAIRIMAMLRESFAAFYRLKRYIPNHEDQKVIWRHHADIYKAVRDRAPAAARAALIAHMDFIENELAESVDGLDAED